jgi:hypothetical protein
MDTIERGAIADNEKVDRRRDDVELGREKESESSAPGNELPFSYRIFVQFLI